MEEKNNHTICSSCGGTLKWNIRKQSFECESCRTPGEIGASNAPIVEHPLKKYSTREQSSVSFPEVSSARCLTCGAEINFDQHQTATVCPMCGSSHVDASKQSAGVPPDALVPFMLDKADAQERFKKWVKSRWFAPNRLKESYQQGKLDGMYLPFWTYDTHSEAHYWGEGGTYVEEEDDEGNTHSHTDWYSVSGYVRKSFNDIQICASSDQGQIVVEQILPYSTEEKAAAYSDKYLSGFNAEHYTFDAHEGFKRAEVKIESELRDLASSDICSQGYDTARVNDMDIEHHKVGYKHLLLPAWLSAFAYKGKQYVYMINGETGKVGGERPYSIPKIAAAILVGLVLLFAIYNIFIKEADAAERVYPINQETITCTVAWEPPAWFETTVMQPAA
ncbi:MAG: hypothetical protein RR614_06980 [Eubacterium sp.]